MFWQDLRTAHNARVPGTGKPMVLGVRWPWPWLGCDTAQTRPAAPGVTALAEPSPPLFPGRQSPSAGMLLSLLRSPWGAGDPSSILPGQAGLMLGVP